MNRIIVLCAAAGVALLALRHPPGLPAPIAASTSAPHARHPRAKHPPDAAPSGVALVYVAGAVVRPGVYALRAGARAADAVQRAGGFRPDADAAAVNLAQPVSDGEEIDAVRAGEATPRPARRSARKRKAQFSGQSVDLNGADATALAALPGIGATLAERIVEYRHLNGPFASLDELADVAGITQRRIDAIAPYITVHDER